jgi:hypothetical protein
MKLAAGEKIKMMNGYRYGTLGGDIITINTYPPIPIRNWDWCAYHDGDDEFACKYGWGKTEQEALDDLYRLDRECWTSKQEEDE